MEALLPWVAALLAMMEMWEGDDEFVMAIAASYLLAMTESVAIHACLRSCNLQINRKLQRKVRKLAS